MDRETHPNAVYKYDAHTQTIYPVDKQTNQPLSEISKLVMSREPYQMKIEPGMIQNLKKMSLYSITNKDGKSVPATNEFSYFADFVIDVFVVPEQNVSVANTITTLDQAFGVINGQIDSFYQKFQKTPGEFSDIPEGALVFNTNNAIINRFLNSRRIALRNFLIGEAGGSRMSDLTDAQQAMIPIQVTAGLNKETIDFRKYLNEDEYFRHNPNAFQYTVKRSVNHWVLHPKFENFKLPCLIVGEKLKKDKEGQFSDSEKRVMLHLNIKMNIRVLSRRNALASIRRNRSMLNFYVYLSNNLTINGTDYSKNLFNGSNMVFMSINQLQRHREGLFFHEIFHAFLKYTDTATNTLEFGEHNNNDMFSYMGRPSSTVAVLLNGGHEFVGNDLLAFTTEDKRLPVDTVQNRNQNVPQILAPKTYGELIEAYVQKHYSNEEWAGKIKEIKDAIKDGKKLEDEKMYPTALLELCMLEIYVKNNSEKIEEGIIHKKRKNYDTENTIAVWSLQLDYPPMEWDSGFGVYTNFIFHQQNIPALIIAPINAPTNNTRFVNSLQFFVNQPNILIN